MTKNKLADIRGEIYNNQLNKKDVDTNPFNQFNKWMNEALKAEILHANAMVLSTANKKGIPSSRTVLLKELDDKGFVFFTNYSSSKANDLKENPNASLLFYWKEFERQARISGKVELVSRDESEKYFKSRPIESQLGAWASNQSEVIPDREYLIKKYDDAKMKFGENKIPCPPYWGGYRLLPNLFEFWQGRQMRLHDRIKYEKKENEWNILRLSP